MQQRGYMLSTFSDKVDIKNEAADKLISSGNGDAALLYIYILRNGGSAEPENAALQLKMDLEKINAAKKELENLGLIEGQITPQSSCNSNDITDALSTDEEFMALTEDTERRLGRPLSRAELERLLYMNRQLSLPAEVLALLISDCVGEFTELYGRSPRIGYIEKAAAEWAELGIFTPELAEQHIEERKRIKSDIGKASRALGIYGRKLSRTEEKYLTEWLKNGYDVEVIERAYDITVLRTGKLSWNYMNSIIRNWQQKGLKTLKDIEAAEDVRKAAPISVGRTPGEHEIQAMAKMRAYMRKSRDNEVEKK